jgi:predicted DNA-binding transcriptional regulator YafY
MRKAERLFQIIQILRRSSQPVTAGALASELETSRRSVYRDVAALIGQRIPIRGEAGIGYVLEGGFDLPPLMLTADEVDAVSLGVHWVAQHGDSALARAASDVLAKIAAVLPEEIRPFLGDSPARSVPSWNRPPDGLDVGQLRLWIRNSQKLAIAYQDESERLTERTLWPLLIGYRDATRLLVAWCELRGDFRTFRLDRIQHATFLDAAIPGRPALLRAQWMKLQNARC